MEHGLTDRKITAVRFCGEAEDALLKYAVIISKSNDKWVYCRHQERTILKLKPMECYTALKFQNLNTICTRKSLK